MHNLKQSTENLSEDYGAQNKKNHLLSFLHFLSYKVRSVEEIELNFFIADHSKLSPDRLFGYRKSTLKITEKVETFADIEDVIKSSSIK